MASEMHTAINQQPNLEHWLVVLFMASCFAFSWWLTPHATWFEHLGKPVFEDIVPKQFGDWVEEADAAANTVINPEQQDALNSLYTQIVSRTYVQQSSGRRIMLSLAYGDNQTFSKQLHRPEACYSSQGFKIENLREEKTQVLGQHIVVNRMTGVLGSRLEQVTYWIRIGDKLIGGPPTALNMARMGMGLKGYIADGLLFRVSEVADESNLSNPLQDQFINALLSALTPEQQVMMIGLSQNK
jgi:EpsI family protein